jgi:hypothetical protein
VLVHKILTNRRDRRLPEAPGGSAVGNSFEGISEFNGGSVVSRAWTILWAKPAVFLGLTFLSLIIPELIGEAFSKASMVYAMENSGMMAIAQGVSALLYIILFLFFQGAVTYAVFQLVMEGRISVRESVGRAFSRAWALCMIGAAYFCCTVASVLAIAIPWLFWGSFWGSIVGLVLVLLLAGFILCALYVATPVCVVERAGVSGSFGRSWVLTSGYRGPIFGMMLPVFIVTGIIYGVVNFIVARVVGEGFAARLIMIIVNVAPTAFANIMPAIAYYGLRAAKESLVATSLAEVFD